jgi:hypothetical protein
MDRKTKILVVVVMSLGWIATGVSIGRFIIYYYRFAPTNHDRTWDIGIAISIAEPAVHIMTACAPATKCLFRYLFPYFARSTARNHTSRGYADRAKTSEARKAEGFSFGLNERGEDIGMDERCRSEGKSCASYGVKRASTDSREDLVDEERKSCMVEAEPQHCLGMAK